MLKIIESKRVCRFPNLRHRDHLHLWESKFPSLPSSSLVKTKKRSFWAFSRSAEGEIRGNEHVLPLWRAWITFLSESSKARERAQLQTEILGGIFLVAGQCPPPPPLKIDFLGRRNRYARICLRNLGLTGFTNIVSKVFRKRSYHKKSMYRILWCVWFCTRKFLG